MLNVQYRTVRLEWHNGGVTLNVTLNAIIQTIEACVYHNSIIVPVGHSTARGIYELREKSLSDTVEQ